jgi:hypothetical protein
MTLTDVGILGLSLPDQNNIHSSLFGEAISQGVFKQPIFTTYLQNDKDGTIVFGDYDSIHCKPVHIWLDIANDSHLWKVNINGYRVGTEWVKYPVEVSISRI